MQDRYKKIHGSHELCPKKIQLSIADHSLVVTKKEKEIHTEKINTYNKYEHLEQGMRIQTKWYHEKENV